MGIQKLVSYYRGKWPSFGVLDRYSVTVAMPGGDPVRAGVASRPIRCEGGEVFFLEIRQALVEARRRLRLAAARKGSLVGTTGLARTPYAASALLLCKRCCTPYLRAPVTVARYFRKTIGLSGYSPVRR